MGYWTRRAVKISASTLFCSMLLLVIVADAASYPTGIVAYWKFDESLNDQLGIYDATMGPSGSYSVGMIDEGLHCNMACSNQIAARVDSFPNLDSFTVEAWIKPACPPGSWQASLSVAKSAIYQYSGPGWYLYAVPLPYGGSIYAFGMGIGDGAVGKDVLGTSRYSCGSWYHVVGIRDKGNEIVVFVNGEEVVSVVDDLGSTANTQPLTFHGALLSSCDWGMSEITLDEVAIYNRALTATEIEQHYRNGLQGRGLDEVIPVSIDIKPSTQPAGRNSINLNEKGLLPVAVLGSGAFDVRNIDPLTIRLGGVAVTTRGSATSPKLAYSYEDINGDGYLDLVALFSVQQLVAAGALTYTTTYLELTANLTDGTAVVGTDTVNVVPP